MDEARALFDRLLSLRNDVGLLSEQYDPASKRLLGNFPQAFSHVSLVNTALNLTRDSTARPTIQSVIKCSSERFYGLRSPKVRQVRRSTGSMGFAQRWVRRFDRFEAFDGS